MADNTWYIAKDDNRSGFTSNPEFARRDLSGHPIIAPGHLIKYQKILVAKAKAVIKERQAQAWEDGYKAAVLDLRNDPQLTKNPYKEEE